MADPKPSEPPRRWWKFYLWGPPRPSLKADPEFDRRVDEFGRFIATFIALYIIWHFVTKYW